MSSKIPVYHPDLDQYALLTPEAAGHIAAQGWIRVEYQPPDVPPEREPKARARKTLGDPTPADESKEN